MHGTKRILRLFNSVYWNHQFHRTHPRNNQVILFSRLPVSIPAPPHTTKFKNALQMLFFSTEAEPTIGLLLSKDWSEDLEEVLTESNLALNHETVMYILRKLNKDPHKALKFLDWACEKNQFKPNSAIYSLMLQAFANKEWMKQFWVTIKTMKEQGFFINEETYKTIYGNLRKMKMAGDATALRHFYNKMLKEGALDNVVKEVFDVVMSSDWDHEVEKKLEEMEILVSDGFVLRALRELRGCRSKALSFFKWVGGRPNYKHSGVTYNAILRVLGCYDSIREFWGMVKEMRSHGHEMDLDTYIKISRRFQKFKMSNEVVELYELMMGGPFKPSDQDCCILLRNLAQVNHPNLDLVFRVVKKYESAGHSLSKPIYDGIHRSLTSVGRFDDAEKIIDSMKDSGYEPDNITYSQLIFGLCKAGKREEACKVLDVMETNGCMPDIKTWTILIQGYCTANEIDGALLCLTKMVEQNCDVDADLLDVLVNGFLSQKKTLGAYQLLVEMVNSARLRPWQSTYKNLIQNLLNERRLEEALKLLRLMKQHEYPPFAEPFTQYISKFGTTEDATDFFKALTVKQYPSISAYVNVFTSFFHEGRLSEAKDLLFKCPLHIRQHKAISSLFGSANASTSHTALDQEFNSDASANEEILEPVER